MRKFREIPTKTLVFISLAIFLTCAALFSALHIQKNSLSASLLALVFILSLIPLGIRFIQYLKAIGSRWYGIVRFFIGYFIIMFPIGIFIVLDVEFKLNSLLCIPGIAVVVGAVLFLFFKNRGKFAKKEYSCKQAPAKPYPFTKLYSDLQGGHEIEFTYYGVRYLFIAEDNSFAFKRIVSADPYEYETLFMADTVEDCIDSAEIEGKKISELWPSVENIVVY